MSKPNKITFIAESEYAWEMSERPIPAASAIPDWWKNMRPYSTDDNTLQMNPGPTVTAKKCFPLLDGISAGYLVTLWSDVMINSRPDKPLVQWGTGQPVFDVWDPSQVDSVELPEGYGQTVLKYLHGWLIQTPPGWSTLITHPIGYPNLPFRAMSGLVDTDTLKTGINTPILIKDGFSGVLEKGTPMFQVIPVKRENWESEAVQGDYRKQGYDNERLRSRIISSYGRNLRSNKSYK